MKVIEVVITLGTSCFVSRCQTASEALDAITDAWPALRGITMDNENRDEIMEVLLRMKAGKTTFWQVCGMRVRIAEDAD